MAELIKAIKRHPDWVQEPIGPIGSYIHVKNQYNNWKPLLSTILNKTLIHLLLPMKVIEVGWTDYSSSIKYVATLLSRKQKD